MNPEDFILPDFPTQHLPPRSRKRGRSPSRDPYDQPTQTRSQAYGQQEEVDSNPMWYKKYEPTTTAELGTANAKIKEVNDAISNSALYKKLHRILLLSGPSGTGKSALVKILCKQHGLELTEWLTERRSFGDEDSINRYVRPIDEFRKFINQCIYFNSFRQQRRGRVILLDDLPDLTTDDVKQTFYQILKDCLEITRPFLIVMVVSDSVTNLDSSKNYEKRTNYLNDVLPPDLREGDTRIKEVKFNGITVPSMRKILKNIAVQENLFLPAARLEQIIQESDGDIRLAINTLQFQSIPIDESSPRDPKEPPPPARRAKDGSKLVEFDEHVGHLSLFHAIGKVVYAKRDTQGNYESTPEHIINKIPVNNDTFISYVHQNCVSFFDDIEDCAKALTELGDADSIRSDVDLQDRVQSVYRNYVSLHGIMKNRKGVVGGKLRQVQAIMFKRDWELKRLPQKANYEAWLASVKERAANYEQDHPMNMREIDPIEPFSSDEEAAFDDIFGDGSELAELDF